MRSVFGLFILMSLFILQSVMLPFSLRAEESPTVGKEAAAAYFQKRAPSATPSGTRSNRSKPRLLSIHVGKFMDTQAYDWSYGGKQSDVGEWNTGVTYLIGEWIQTMDLQIRIDYQDFDFSGRTARKLAFLPLVIFPDAASRFPLYFGAGAGLGVFFNQINEKSPLSLDYQLILGARFLNVFQNTGFFLESGLKNHLHLLSSGQFNGTFLNFGTVFNF